MSNKNNIVNPIESLPKLNCFKVPQGYFERLQHNIELRIALEDMPFEERLLSIKNKTAFSLPTNYFDTLASRIAEQTTNEKSVWETLPNGDGFIVPQGYFNSLYQRIADRISAGVPVRPWWQPAPALRPILAFAGVALLAVAIAVPLLTNTPTQTNGLALVKPNEKLVLPQPATNNNPIVADIAVAKINTKTAVTKNKADSSTDEFDLLGITGGDYSDELTLSEIPTANTNTAENDIVEILAEEDIDLTEVINAGL